MGPFFPPGGENSAPKAQGFFQRPLFPPREVNSLVRVPRPGQEGMGQTNGGGPPPKNPNMANPFCNVGNPQFVPPVFNRSVPGSPTPCFLAQSAPQTSNSLLPLVPIRSCSPLVLVMKPSGPPGGRTNPFVGLPYRKPLRAEGKFQPAPKPC